jgi:hypothetical protein
MCKIQLFVQPFLKTLCLGLTTGQRHLVETHLVDIPDLARPADYIDRIEATFMLILLAIQNIGDVADPERLADVAGIQPLLTGISINNKESLLLVCAQSYTLDPQEGQPDDGNGNIRVYEYPGMTRLT